MQSSIALTCPFYVLCWLPQVLVYLLSPRRAAQNILEYYCLFGGDVNHGSTALLLSHINHVLSRNACMHLETAVFSPTGCYLACTHACRGTNPLAGTRNFGATPLEVTGISLLCQLRDSHEWALFGSMRQPGPLLLLSSSCFFWSLLKHNICRCSRTGGGGSRREGTRQRCVCSLGTGPWTW